MLRDRDCDLLITPLPPVGTDIVQRRLLQDNYVCFFDARMRQAPTDSGAYLAARHITVVYPNNEQLDFDRRLDAQGLRRDIAVSVTGFAGVPAFLTGSRMLATMPGLLREQVLRGFAETAVPIVGQSGTLADLPMYLVWHQRFQNDPTHSWLRQQMLASAAAKRRLIHAAASSKTKRAAPDT
jgi:DNA-binding transcriptional LysR family regulator